MSDIKVVRNIKFALSPSDEILSTTIITAVEGGINYWAQVSNYKWDLDDPTVTSVRVHEVEAEHGEYEAGHDIGLDEIAKGMERMLQPEAKIARRIKDTLLTAINSDDGGDIDAEVADCVMQFAVLGELVYG